MTPPKQPQQHITMKNPKTTFSGLIGALPLLGLGIAALIGGDISTGITKILEAASIVLLGYFAKDANSSDATA